MLLKWTSFPYKYRIIRDEKFAFWVPLEHTLDLLLGLDFLELWVVQDKPPNRFIYFYIFCIILLMFKKFIFKMEILPNLVFIE